MVLAETTWMSELIPWVFLTEKSRKEILYPPWMLIRIANLITTESSSKLINSKMTEEILTEDVNAFWKIIRSFVEEPSEGVSLI